MSRMIERELRFPDHPELAVRGWTADATVPPAGCVGILHGLGEHAGRYGHVAQVLTAAGYAVVACDLPGHGRSAGRRGAIRSYDSLLDVVERLAAEVRIQAQDRPAILYGHSFGGALVLNYALRRNPPWTGLVATSPLLLPGRPPAWWKTLLARAIRRWLPDLSFDHGISPQELTHDDDAARSYRQDPLVHRRVSARLGLAMLDAGRWTLDHASQLPIPALIMHGDADTVTSPEASRQFAARAGALCTLKIWPGLRHELHWETQRDAVLQFLRDWLRDVARRPGYGKGFPPSRSSCSPPTISPS